ATIDGTAASATIDRYGSPSGGGPRLDPRTVVGETPGDLFKQMLDSHIPLVTSALISGPIGHEIKDLVKAYADVMFGQSSNITKNVGNAFKLLGVVAKIEALALFYADTTVKVEMEADTYHQPDGAVQKENVIVHAGIDEAEWAAARQA